MLLIADVVLKGPHTGRCMVATTFISKERLKAVRRVAVADCVAKESLETGSGIAVGYSAASQRLKTIGGVGAGDVAKES